MRFRIYKSKPGQYIYRYHSKLPWIVETDEWICPLHSWEECVDFVLEAEYLNLQGFNRI